MKVNIKQAGGPQKVAIRFAKAYEKQRKIWEKENAKD